MTKDLETKLEWMFSDLVFEEKAHTYHVNGVPFPSVSSLIKEHETPVDFDLIAERVAIRNNKTKSQVQREWDKIKDDACALGSETHLYAENYDGTQEPINNLQFAAKKFFDELPEYYIILSKELRMYSKAFKYAGTADLVLFDTRDNSLVIADFKTNKDLFKSFHQLQGIFSDLEQSNFNKYQLQLSYYQIMLEQTGVDVSNRVIIWLQRDGTYKVYQTEDYTKELKLCMLNKN